MSLYEKTRLCVAASDRATEDGLCLLRLDELSHSVILPMEGGSGLCWAQRGARIY